MLQQGRAVPYPHTQLQPSLSSRFVSATMAAHKETSQYRFNPRTAAICATLLQNEYINYSLAPYTYI